MSIESAGVVRNLVSHRDCSIVNVIGTVWREKGGWFVMNATLCHLDFINTEKIICPLH